VLEFETAFLRFRVIDQTDIIPIERKTRIIFLTPK